MCESCCPTPRTPRISRGRFLQLAGVGAAAMTAPGALTATASAASRGTADTAGRGPLLVDNVRGYTLARGKLRRFSRMLLTPGGRVAALDLGAVPKGVRRLDGRGRVLLPGLHDAHGHLWGLGALAVELNLVGTGSLAEALDRLAAYDADHPDEPWILGRGWNEVVWGLGRLPTAADLDGVVADRPVWLVRVDGHAGVANTKALKAVGVTADTPDPDGGRIIRDGAGHLSTVGW